VKRLPISKLSIDYQNNIKNKRFKLFIKRNINLNLSIHFSRDDREFNIANYILLKNLLKKDPDIKKFIKKKDKINGYYKYFYTFKEFKYCIKKYLPLLIISDLIKICMQIVDIIGIIFLTLYQLLLNKISSLSKQKERYKNNKIFSIYYWIKKGNKSASYYYPQAENLTERNFVIISFADSKLISIGLFISLLKEKYLTPGKILSLKSFFNAIIDFFCLFLYDFFLPIIDPKYSFLSFWFGWKKGAEIFYSLLIYNSIKDLSHNSKNCEFISWQENQITNKSFSLGVTNGLKKNKTKSLLSSYLSSPLSENSKKQFLPNFSECLIGLYGTKVYVQDENSLLILKKHFKKNGIRIPIQTVNKNLVRMKVEENKYNSEISKNKNITIFSGESNWDVIACLLALLNTLNLENKNLLNSIDFNKEIYIRLHPIINKENLINEIREIKEIPNDIVLRFIDHKEESIIYSMRSSKYCVFGLSTYINIALGLNCKILAVYTNHLYSNFSKSIINKNINLKLINPW